MSKRHSHTGRVGVVTGGAQGIGYAVAESLVDRGADLAIFDINSTAADDAAERLSKRAGTRVIGVGVDVADTESVERAFQTTESKLGSVELLVNNAGILTPRLEPAECVSAQDFDRMLAVHVRGSFLCSARALPEMKRKGYGRIAMMSSLVGPLGFDRRLAYATAKEGITGMMRSLAVEAGRYGVTVNAVAPGWIRTPLVVERLSEGTLDGEALMARTPLGRWGEGSDVGETIAALFEPPFDYVTGVVLPVDGGYRICGDHLVTEA